MIEEKAIVVSTSEKFAQVQTQRRTACGVCAAQSGCGTSLLSKVFGNKRSSLSVLKTVNAKPGDQVVIGLEEQVLVKISLVVYLVPLLGLILSAVVGKVGAEELDILSPELVSIFSGLIGLLIALSWVRRFMRSIQTDRSYQAVILRMESDQYLSSDQIQADPLVRME